MRTVASISLLLTAVLASGSANAVTDFNDGGEHIIDYLIDDYWVYVDYNTPGIGTSVKVVSGGFISHNLYAYGDSQVTVSGGHISYLRAEDRSELIVSGGTVGNNLTAYDYSRVTMSGGSIGENFWAFGYNEVVISGGEIGGYLVSYHETKMNITGGLIRGSLANHANSQVVMSGGNIGGKIYAGHWDIPYDSCLMTFVGTAFEINGQSVDYGSFASDYAIPRTDSHGRDYLTGTLTGNLLNGGMLDNTFYLYEDADITFVPEQSPPILAEVDIEPDTLNLNSKGKWITCYILLPDEYNVADVNSASVFLENEIGVAWIWADEQTQVVVAKFSRSALQEMLAELDTIGEVELLVTGELADGTKFKGTDIIRAIDKGKK